MWRVVAMIGGLGWLLSSAPADAGLFGGPPWSYIAEPIEGRVVDQTTGQPIAGAVVVAQWVLAKPPEGDTYEPWVVIEAVTDAEGRYHIPGWGPKRRPWFRWLSDYDPQLVIFNSGYWHESIHNGERNSFLRFNPHEAKFRRSYWNGKDISLWRFEIGRPIEQQLDNPFISPYRTKPVLTEEEWAKDLHFAQSAVIGSLSIDKWTADDWLRIRTFVSAINQECLRLPSKLRYQFVRIPNEYAVLLLGDTLPCR